MTYDIVFVGSGINSLAGASLLARAGRRVLVLERNDYLGGAIQHAFKRLTVANNPDFDVPISMSNLGDCVKGMTVRLFDSAKDFMLHGEFFPREHLAGRVVEQRMQPVIGPVVDVLGPRLLLDEDHTVVARLHRPAVRDEAVQCRTAHRDRRDQEAHQSRAAGPAQR